MSVKNTMPFLRETLASVESQTYQDHQLFVWDDCSTDGTLEELQRWIPNRIPGRIYAGESKRLGASLAYLVEQSPSELCARIDGDDINFPTRLEQQVAFMLAHPTVGMTGGQVDIIDETGEVQEDGQGWTYATDDASLRWRSRWQAQFCHPTVMFRRSVILSAGNYRDVRESEDFDLWLRVAEVTEVSNLPDRVLKYRRSRTSATGRIVEFLPYEREVARSNAERLFPNIRNRARAMDLWEATHPLYPHKPSRFRHLIELKNAAIAFAQKAGKPRDYFVNTLVFQQQYESLKTRFYRRNGLVPLRNLWHHLLRRA